MGRLKPLTEAEKENLRRQKKERDDARKKTGTESGKTTDPKTRSGGGGDPGGGSGGGTGGGDGVDPHSPSGSGGGPSSGTSAKEKGGRKISKTERALEVVVDSNKFFNGLPAFSRLLFRAANNCVKIFNILPFVPFEFEIEDMTPEEADTFSAAVKPGLEIALPSAGKKHPFKMMIAAFAVGILGKLKAKMKPGWGRKKKPPIDITPEQQKKEENENE